MKQRLRRNFVCFVLITCVAGAVSTLLHLNGISPMMLSGLLCQMMHSAFEVQGYRTPYWGCQHLKIVPSRDDVLISVLYKWYTLGGVFFVCVGNRLQAKWLRNCGMMLGGRKRIFFSPKCPDQLWGPPTLVSVGIKRHEADHSLPSSVGAIPPRTVLPCYPLPPGKMLL
jgi:hypothetical protein